MRYLFEEYAFDAGRRELHRGADRISVTPLVFDLLDYLIRNRERVVGKMNSSMPFGRGAACPMPR
ncbi:Adenylate cyclase EC 4611 CDS [Bradyrhizobium sp.]|nr:Adenylate cyclase EC 4611 CDS [Bradyrhizobium sp.]